MARSTEPPLEKQPDHPIVLFQAADGQVCLDVRLEEDTVWLSQAQMAELFGRERSVISKHIGNVFKEGELDAAATCAKFAQVQTEGSRLIQRSPQERTLWPWPHERGRAAGAGEGAAPALPSNSLQLA